jgi:hypothetical protein
MADRRRQRVQIADCASRGFFEQGEAEANARLIAAAPELLAACKMCLAIEHSQEQCPNGCDVCQGLEAVIAKAEGHEDGWRHEYDPFDFTGQRQEIARLKDEVRRLREELAKIQPAPASTQDARHKAAYAEAHAARECGPRCPWCEEMDAENAMGPEAEPTDAAMLCDLLSLTHAAIPLETIATWSEAERAEACDWAAAVILDASDNLDIVVPPMPACVAAGREPIA